MFSPHVELAMEDLDLISINLKFASLSRQDAGK